MMFCNSTTKRPNGEQFCCGLELGHTGQCFWVTADELETVRSGLEQSRSRGRTAALFFAAFAIAFVVVLANFCGGCGRINYEPVDDDAGASSSALLGSWQRSDGACELSMVFDDAGVVTLERACDAGCTFHLQGGYELDGDVLRFDLEIDGVAVVPGSAPWHVDEPELELGGATWQRVGDAGELAGVCQ